MSKFEQVASFMAIFLFVLVGCSVQSIPHGVTQTESIIPTQKISPISNPTSTITPSPSPTLSPTISMEEFFRADEYILESVMRIKSGNHYEIRSWDNPSNDWISNHRVSISNGAFETILIDDAKLGQLPRFDITGEGDPDIIIYGWGARLANPVYIYNLGDELTRVFKSYRPSGCAYDLYEFKDLDSNGIPEILTCDAYFGGFDCGPSMGPIPLIVYSYDSEIMQYNIVSPLFPEIYSEEIERLTKIAEEFPESKCTLSGLVMNYAYSGQSEKGWSELTRIYQGNDIESFQQEIEELLQWKRDRGIYITLEDLETE